MEKMLTISQLSRLSGKTRNTIMEWCDKGRISSIRQEKRTLVSLSEALRVFPEMDGAKIENELNKATPVHAVVRSDAVQPVASVDELERKVERLELEKSLLLEKIALLERERNNLERERNSLESMLTREADRVDQLVGRLLPAESSAKRRTDQPRGEHGRFAAKGEGVKALIQD